MISLSLDIFLETQIMEVMIKEKKATCVVYSESMPCRTGLTHKANIPRDPAFSLHYALRGLIID